MEYFIGIGILVLFSLTIIMFIWFQKLLKNAAIIEAKRNAFKQAADIIKEKADFEMADTEGNSLTRANRARLLFEAELELRSIASSLKDK